MTDQNQPNGHSSVPKDLSSNQELFHLLVDRVKDYAIFALDPNGRVASWNEGARLLKGYRDDEIIGQPIDRFYPPADVAAGVPARLLQTARTEGRVEAEGWRVRKDGTRFWADVVITPLFDGDELRGYAKVTRDLTERRRAEEALQAAHLDLATRVKALARSNSDLEQFAYIASHDLQEPIRMVITHVQLLAEEYHDHLQGEAQEYIKFVLEGARRMQRLVKDLLTYSRIARSGPQTFSAVNCEAVLQHAVANLGVAIAESGAEVTHAPLPTILGDESLLVQLFQNLINNGIKFRRQETPRITIGARQVPGEWVFFFQDNGIGIEKDYLEQIFIPFRRLHAHEEYPGTGIGLAICKKVAEYHGGRIWVESVPGEGSTFRVTFPSDSDPKERGDRGL